MNQHQICPVDSSAEFPDHETLSRLAVESPSAFEDLRQQLIEGLINTAPGRMQARLRGVQFRVDSIRRLTHSSLGATVKIYALMWNSFLEMDQQLRDFVVLTRTNSYRPVSAIAESQPYHSAKIIQFRRPQIVNAPSSESAR
jgi:hypothetical protein